LSGLLWSARVHNAAQPAAARARQAQPDQRMAAASPRVERVGHPNPTPAAGAAAMAADWFHALGFTMPYGVNVAGAARALGRAARPSGRTDRPSRTVPSAPRYRVQDRATRFVDPEAVPSWDRSDVCGVEGTFSWCFGASCCLTPGARVGGTDFILDLASGAVTSAKLDEAGAREHLVCCAELYAQARRRPDLKQSGERLELDGRLGSEDAGSRR